MALSLNLSNGQPAFRTEIGLSTLDLATLEMRIEVVGYDADGNRMRVVHVPYKINALREVLADEIEAAVIAHLEQLNEERLS